MTLYYSKKNVEEVQQEETNVWLCSTPGCSCWMRENFSFVDTPLCPLCKSEMVKDMKMLPALVNNTRRS